MKANLSVSLRSAGLLAGALIALSGAELFGAGTKQVDAFPVFDSYIKISGQAASINGNGAAFARRAQQSEDGAVGIEALLYNQELSNDRTMVIEGRVLPGLEDYLGKISLTKSDVGTVDMGYKSFRTFYDGIGGFFPLNNQWFALSNRELHVDRGEFWIGAKLTMPDKPEIEVKYSNSTRSGRKDSTILGRSDFTGLPNNNPPISPARGIFPGVIDLSERAELLKGIVKGTVGHTSYEVELFTERTDDNSTRYAVNYPGEARPYPTPASTLLVPAANMNNQQTITSVYGNKADIWGLLGKAETELSDRIKLISGFGYTNLESDITGDRPLVTVTPTAVGQVSAVANNFKNLMATATSDTYVARLGAEFKASKDLTMKLLVRWEDKYTKSAMTYINVANSISATTGASTVTETLNKGYSRFKETSWTPDLEVRYTGIANVTLYANASKKQADGDENYASPHSTATPSTNNLTIFDAEEAREKYTVGGSWRATDLVTLRGELFFKDNTLHNVGYDVRIGDNYQLDNKFTGYKLSAIAKPSSQLSFTTRYIYQQGESQVTGYLPQFPKYEALDMEVHSFGETVDWTPNDQFYMQGNLNVVYNVYATINGRAGIAPASGSNQAWNVNALLKNANNNYVSGSVIAGAVLTKTDDLQVQLNYYKADNYDPELAPLGMPYGASAKDISITVGVKHKFTDRMMGDFKLGYVDSDNPTSGGNTNFDGLIGYVALNYAL